MGSGLHLKRAIKKYGKENFRKEWLMFCEDAEELNYMEMVYVDETWIGRSDTYNIILGGQKMGRCGKLTEEHKRKLSRAHKGKTPWNKGKNTPEHVKEKLSTAHKGKPTWLSTHGLSRESVEKMRKSLLGRKPANAKRVCQYALDGTFIAEYNTVKEATDKTGTSNVAACCRGERKTSGGYVWRWKDGK